MHPLVAKVGKQWGYGDFHCTDRSCFSLFLLSGITCGVGKTQILMSQHVISIRDHCVYAYHRLKESPGHDIRVATQGSRGPDQVPDPQRVSGFEGTKGHPGQIMSSMQCCHL